MHGVRELGLDDDQLSNSIAGLLSLLKALGCDKADTKYILSHETMLAAGLGKNDLETLGQVFIIRMANLDGNEMRLEIPILRKYVYGKESAELWLGFDLVE